MGSEIHLHVNSNNKDVVIIVPSLGITAEQRSTFTYGGKISFAFGGNVCHVFDSEGKNLEM